VSPFDLIPADVGLSAAIALCAIAFVAATARGFQASARR
jgi:hypothetical protein